MKTASCLIMKSMLGLLLKQEREKRGWNQKELAKIYATKSREKEKAHPSGISQWESGKYEIKRERLQNILEAAFGYSPFEAQSLISEFIVKTEAALVNRDKLSSMLNLDPVDLHPRNLIPVYDGVGAGLVPGRSMIELINHLDLYRIRRDTQIIGDILVRIKMPEQIWRQDTIVVKRFGASGKSLKLV